MQTSLRFSLHDTYKLFLFDCSYLIKFSFVLSLIISCRSFRKLRYYCDMAIEVCSSVENILAFTWLCLDIKKIINFRNYLDALRNILFLRQNNIRHLANDPDWSIIICIICLLKKKLMIFRALQPSFSKLNSPFAWRMSMTCFLFSHHKSLRNKYHSRFL